MKIIKKRQQKKEQVSKEEVEGKGSSCRMGNRAIQFMYLGSIFVY